jgi:hypothetical protein
MKLFKSTTLAALVLVTTGLASAQTVIRIVGSNGDRTATQTAISKLLAQNSATWSFRGTSGYTTNTGTLSTATGANFGAWNGTFNGSPVVIKVSFSGALAGIAAVAGNTDQRFVVTNGADGTTAVPNPLTAANLNVDYQIGKADFGFSTNFQSTSPFNGTFEGVSYNTVTEEVVGVTPLGFYASPGFPTSGAATNLTTQLAQLLYTTGSVPLSLFTGDFTGGDQNKIVYALGRNTDAGQRFGAYAEIGLGNTSVVKVFQPTYSTAATTTSGITYGGVIGSHALWPAETVSSIYSPLGSGGFSSGALVAQNLTVTLGPNAYKGNYTNANNQPAQLYPNATAGYYIGYVTPGDAVDRILGTNGVVPPANRGVALKYNGVDLTNANVQNGKYTAWVYNRILKPQSGLVGLQSTFADALRDQIKNVDAPSGGGLFDDASFKVTRSADGGLVTPK